MQLLDAGFILLNYIYLYFYVYVFYCDKAFRKAILTRGV